MLRRKIAPLSEAAWDAVEEEVRDTMQASLVGRRIVDVTGPHGWDHAAYNLGTLEMIDGETVTAGLREVQRVVETRTPFRLKQMAIDSVDRGGAPDFDGAVEAAQAATHREDRAIFHGWKEAGIAGISDAAGHKPLSLPKSGDGMPGVVFDAIAALRGAGVQGPYHLVMGSGPFQKATGATKDGVAVRKLIQQRLDGGDILHAPAVDGALLVSGRGGDFVLDIGHDFALGYASHDRDEVELYVTQSFTFRVIDGDAAIAMR